MNQPVFDAEIGLYEKELIEIIAKMEKTKQAFIAAAVACLKAWYHERARKYVQEKYDLTNKLGLARITQMKARIKQLIEATDADAIKLLGNDNLWWHRTRGGGWQDSYTPGPPDGLQMAVDALSEKIIPILEAYGYIKRTPGKEKSDDAKPQSSSLPQLEWTEPMTKCVDAYKEDLGRATFLDSKMQQARARKAKHNAGLLWDKA